MASEQTKVQRQLLSEFETIFVWMLIVEMCLSSFSSILVWCVHGDYGVDKGSVLGPLLFSLHRQQGHGVNLNSYADNTQLYVAESPDEPNTATSWTVVQTADMTIPNGGKEYQTPSS